jgi:hypothetical protein
LPLCIERYPKWQATLWTTDCLHGLAMLTWESESWWKAKRTSPHGQPQSSWSLGTLTDSPRGDQMAVWIAGLSCGYLAAPWPLKPSHPHLVGVKHLRWPVWIYIIN